MAECRNASQPHQCKAGFVGDTRVSVSWEAPFFDDKVTDVLGYRVEFSEDAGATWMQHVKAAENDPGACSPQCVLSFLDRLRIEHTWGNSSPQTTTLTARGAGSVGDVVGEGCNAQYVITRLHACAHMCA
jgi:hypothetical protein